MGRKRFVWVDSLKGMLIVLVVLGHAIQCTIGSDCESNHLWNIIYSFHMPAFMVVSGFLAFRPHSHSFWGNLVFRRFRQLMIPFFLWTFIFLFLKNEFSFVTIGSYLLNPNKGLWFLWVLFFITWLFVAGEWLAQKLRVRQEGVELCICMILVLVMVIFEPRILGFQFIAYYYLFYTLGYYLHKHQEKLVFDRWTIIIPMLACWLVLAWFWKMHELPDFLHGNLIPSTILQYFYRFITAAIAIYVLIAIALKFLESKQKWNKPLEHIGKVSLGIYTVHMMLIGHIVDKFKQCTRGEDMVIVFSFAIVLMVSWGVVWILNENKYTAMLFLGKL